ncbi:MAG: FHA domain-containing protein [Myxococcales bacterium]|nr:FHA domain-containing protein [Myxococcales bacterium]
MTDHNKKTLRHFQCRDYLWDVFSMMSQELECSVDYLINESMRQYARSRNYGTRPGNLSAQTGSAAAFDTQTGATPLGSPAAAIPALGGGGPDVAPAQATPSPQAPPPQAAPPPAPPPQAAPPPAAPPPMAPPPQAAPPTPAAPPPQAAPPPPAAPPPTAPPSPSAPPPPWASEPAAPEATPAPLGAAVAGIMAHPGQTSSDRSGSMRPTNPPAARNPSIPPPLPGSSPPAAPQSLPRLTLLFNNERYPIAKGEFVIGRGSKTADLAIKDGNISRRHCAVVLENNEFWIKDLGSTNGIEFQGQRVESKRIDEGDLFLLCDYQLRFTYQ